MNETSTTLVVILPADQHAGTCSAMQTGALLSIVICIAQRASALSDGLAISSMRRNQLNVAGGKDVIERITIKGTIPDLSNSLAIAPFFPKSTSYR